MSGGILNILDWLCRPLSKHFSIVILYMIGLSKLQDSRQLSIQSSWRGIYQYIKCDQFVRDVLEIYFSVQGNLLFIIKKGAICQNWPPVEFILKWGQHITRLTLNCCQQQPSQQVNSVSCAASSSYWEVQDQGSVSVYTTSRGALDQNGLGLAGYRANFSRHLWDTTIWRNDYIKNAIHSHSVDNLS